MTPHEPFRGIFPILQTPFREDDTIDVACLRREVEFVIASGGHGMCWPQAGGEFALLTDEERFETAELLVRQVRGRVPVIIGVQSTHYWKRALDFARHAELIGADGIISLPPFQAGPSTEDVANYFRTLARSVSLPIFVQNTGGRYGEAMPVDALVALAREYPTVSYIKDEAEPRFERMEQLCREGEGVLRGVFPAAGPGTCSRKWKSARTGAALARTWSTSLAGSLTSTRQATGRRPSSCLTACLPC